MSETLNWLEANQRYLMAAVRQVRAEVERHGSPDAPAGDESSDIPPLEAFGAAGKPAIEVICERFGLSAFERSILLLCAGVELDASIGALCAAMQSGNLHAPTFSLALAALPGAHWSAIAAESPLRHWKLVEVRETQTSTLVTSPLQIDERVLHFLTGIQELDQRLAGAIMHVHPVPQPLTGSHAEVAEAVEKEFGADVLPLIQLCGTDERSKRDIAAAAAAHVQMHLLAIDADAIPAAPADVESFARLADREAALTVSALYIDTHEVDTADPQAVRRVTRLIERLGGPLFIAARDRWRTLRRRARTFDVAAPPRHEQHALWAAALGPAAETLNGAIGRLAAQFDLSAAAIRTAVEDSGGEGTALAESLWRNARAAARPRLETLAQRIDVVAAREHLVLPEPELTQLGEIAVHVAHRATVYERWGFARASARGLGISALFAGPSGTGKTLAAEVLANELQLDLYRIDLSSVVNKYIGETEKNLRRVFEAAEDGGAILFFDEADALFGKRAEVKDSHDRYANIEVNYLLQRMESYRGLAILATNRKSDLDPAFVRRIRFIVNFPFPDQSQRLEIWRRIFPSDAPLAEIDYGRLARLNLSGGNIRNIAMNAAFLAAADDRPIDMTHLMSAAQREHAKLERPLVEGA